MVKLRQKDLWGKRDRPGRGRRLWHSKTTQFKGADLVIGSSRPGEQAKLGVDQPGKAFFIIKDCPFHD